MRISIVHPSKGRPSMALQTFSKWISKAAEDDIEYILSVDDSDIHLPDYERMLGVMVTKLVISSNQTMVEATNSGAKHATGDLIVLVSDDFDCPLNWDVMLKLTASTIETPQFLIYPDDGYSTGQRLATIPILSKPLYDRLGYIYNPVYRSMWADNDLYETCDKLGVLVPIPIRFPHNHWTNGKRAQDMTDRQHSADWIFKQGQETFKKRQQEGFPA